MDFTVTCNMTAGSPILTVASAKDAKDLYIGMHAYSSNLITCTVLNNIVSTTLTLDSNSIADGSFNVVFSDLTPVQYLEKCEVLKEAQQTIDQLAGGVVKIFVRDESDLTRGKYRSIRKRSNDNPVYIKAWPIIHNPTTKALEKLGLREEADLAITIPSKSWTDNGYTFKDFDLIRFTVIFNNESYEIKEVTRTTQIHNDFVFLNIGLFHT